MPPLAKLMPSTTFRSLTIGEDIDFPNGLEIVYATGPWAHGSGLIDIRRAYRMGGEVHHEVLRNDFIEGQQLRSMATGREGTPIFASVCRGELCGYELGPKPDAVTTIYRSDDLGVSWREIARKPGEQWLTWADGRAWSTDPSVGAPGEGLTWEALDGSGLSFRSQVPRFMEFLGTSARQTEGELRDREGNLVFKLVLPDGSAQGLKFSGSLFPATERIFGRFSVTSGPENTPKTDSYFVEFTDEGKVKTAFKAQPVEVPGIGPQVSAIEDVIAPISGNKYLVTASFTRPGLCTGQNLRIGNAFAVLDLEAGTLSFIKDFVRSTPEEPCGFIPGGGVAGLAVLSGGSLYRVNTPGSCLNLRSKPGDSGEIITCLADGVILQGGGPATEVDGRIWGGFVFPGISGGAWAAMEFLQARY